MGKVKNILITGVAGFAGSGLANLLLKKDYNVTGLDVVAPAHATALFQHNIFDNIRFRYIWKSVQDIIPEDLKNIDIIAHLAAQADVPMGFRSPRWTVEQNVAGTISLLEACKGLSNISKVIIASSGNAFGRPIYLPIDENHPLTPHNPYAFSKAAEEMAGMAYKRCYDVPVTIMSNGACLGPGMRREIFVFKWLYNIEKGAPVILEGGSQTRDLTYVSDILNAWELVIEADCSLVNGEKFQVSYGKEHTVEEILEFCFKACKKRTPVIKTNFRPGEEGQRELFTNQKARTILGYNPVISPEQGIELTLEWVRKEVL